MKIGLFGGIANNMYVVAKALNTLGYEIIFVRDIIDCHPFSQPVWEDVEFTISYNNIVNFQIFNIQYWFDLEKKLGWSAPEWIITPDYKLEFIKELSYFKNSTLRKIGYRRLLNFFVNYNFKKNLLKELKKADLLIVCGVNGAIIAYHSKKPFIIWPHGGDIRLAAGISEIKNIKELIKKWQLVKAYKNALMVGSHDPTGIAGFLGDILYFLSQINYKWLPIPHKERIRSEREHRIKILEQIMQQLNIHFSIEPNNLICFVPSRIDFYWKGQDILLKALSKKKMPIQIFFVGWGNDYKKAIQLSEDLNIKNQLVFLPFALSKPLLYKFYDAVDLVIDQFKLGTYGTTVVETMASGTPIMMWINNKQFENKGWQPPPVINVSNENEIYNVFQKILDGKVDLKQLSEQTKQWFLEHHSYKAFSNVINNSIFNSFNIN